MQFSSINSFVLNHNHNLPDDIYLALSSVSEPAPEANLEGEEQKEFLELSNEERKREFLAGRLLLKKLWAESTGNEDDLIVLKNKFGKPYGKSANVLVNLSLAHSDSIIFGGISRVRDIGIDLEPVERNVDERLGKRLYHPNEDKTVQSLPLIRLWTIKEALVKLHGRGLRTNLKDVLVQQNSKHEFFGIFDNDKTAIICSFEEQEHWLAVAYYRK